jgi:hypothetical protein
MCQELGHTLGLAHRDDDYTTYCDSCMDYSKYPNPSPQQKDLAFLDVIYSNHCKERHLQVQSGENKTPLLLLAKLLEFFFDDDRYSTTYAIVYKEGTWVTEVLWVDTNDVG